MQTESSAIGQPMFDAGNAAYRPNGGVKDIGEYLDTFRRRKLPMLWTTTTLFLLVAAVVLLWPSSYRSTATILIEEQEIPPDLVRSTVSSYADQRIQVISQQVMTRANLMQIIDKYKLYDSYRANHTNEDVLDRLRKDIRLDILKADVIDQRSGAKTTATIAFTLSYDGESPGVAQQVANELVSLYLNENLKNRQQQSAETATFLSDEAVKLKDHISDIEKQLAAFKARNVGRLPELAPLNMQLRDRTENELKDVDRELLSLNDRNFYLESQLAQLKPNTPLISTTGERVLDSTERLKTLQAQYASLSGVYSADHPDIVKMRREIDALQKETSRSDGSSETAKRLTGLRAELAALRDRYSDDHPDVVKLKKAIAALEASQTAAAGKTAEAKPENPAYIALQAQLESNQSAVKSFKAKQAELRSKVAFYERALVETPQIEREYMDLTRDRDASVARYQEIKSKQMQAQISQQLEKDRKGERFSLIDPPQLPEQPSSPNRPLILALGMVLSMGGGLASGALAESLDHSVRGSKALAGLAAVPVLAVIPYMETQRDKQRRRRIRAVVALIALLLAVLALTLVHYFVIPLDVLWFRFLRKIDVVLPGMSDAGPDLIQLAAWISWIA
jgi:succinoglycan biosynthesis transport protein ExoP